MGKIPANPVFSVKRHRRFFPKFGKDHCRCRLAMFSVLNCNCHIYLVSMIWLAISALGCWPNVSGWSTFGNMLMYSCKTSISKWFLIGCWRWSPACFALTDHRPVSSMLSPCYNMSEEVSEAKAKLRAGISEVFSCSAQSGVGGASQNPHPIIVHSVANLRSQIWTKRGQP